MEMCLSVHFKEFGGYRKCCHECSLGVYLVNGNVLYVPSDALSLYQILRYCISKIWGIKKVLSQCTCSSARGGGGGYLPSYKVELQCIGN